MKNPTMTFIAIFFAPIITFTSVAEAQSPSDLGGCTVIADGSRLMIIGNEAANIIDIVGSDSGVQVACDGVADTFTGVEEITVEAGDGDDAVNVDNSNGLVEGIDFNIFGQVGNDVNVISLDLFPSGGTGYACSGGLGIDEVRITAGGLRALRFDIVPGPDANSVEAQVTDIATEMPFAEISGSALEVLTVKMGEGNDQANVSQLVGMALNILSQEGDDDVTLLMTPLEILPLLPLVGLLDLGGGFDKFSLVGATSSESYEISGVPDQRIPDPEIRVTDVVTGAEIADVHVQQTEEIMIDADDGDDRVEVNWDAALMSGLSLIHADLGQGNDMFVSNLLPVLTEPPTREVQIARFEIDAGRGNDQVTFDHSAGSWFDVFFTVRMGLGVDRVNALLIPPPDDGIPGPEGLRRLQLDLLAGNGEDLVAVHNLTTGEFFDVFLEADLGGDDDTFEAVGGIVPCTHPGRGFDTARVTRNLLPFVTEFERVEILE